MRIGFAIVTHGNWPMAQRLLHTLNAMFDMPPIGWHHDFGQSPLPENALTSNVSLVRPHFRTGWGDLGFVEACLAAAEAARSAPDPPEWIFLLSGVDYPVADAARIRAEAGRWDEDAVLRYMKVHPEGEPPTWNEEWRLKALQRYLYRPVRIPWPRRSMGYRRTFWIKSTNCPVLPLYGGPNWFAIRSSAVDAVLAKWREMDSLKSFLGGKPSADEALIPTVFAHSGIKIRNDRFKFVRFTYPNPSPDVLREQDFEEIVSSGALFARKFDPAVDEGILDRLDAHMGVAGAPRTL